jgi:hypothetical protein
MEIVLIKNTEINGIKFKKSDRLNVTNQVGRQLIADKWARPWPNMMEKIENQLSKIIKPKHKEN